MSPSSSRLSLSGLLDRGECPIQACNWTIDSAPRMARNSYLIDTSAGLADASQAKGGNSGAFVGVRDGTGTRDRLDHNHARV